MVDAESDRHLTTIDDLLAACRLASTLVTRGQEQYRSDPFAQLAAEALITRIGEGLSRIPDAVLDRAPGIPRRAVRGMRNLVVHEYQRIDHDLVWHTLADFVPTLAEDLATLRADLRQVPQHPDS